MQRSLRAVDLSHRGARVIRVLCLTVGLSLCAGGASPLPGQDVHGAIQGRVLGSSGEPEPAVEVVASGPHLIGPRRAATDDQGYFRFLALPHGRYSLRLSRVGKRTILLEDVRVELGRVTGLGELALGDDPVSLEPLLVVVRQQTLDPLRTDVGARVTAADYRALPGDRDYLSVLTILPHVNESHRGDPLNAAGSTGLENAYFIDGVNVTAPVRADRGTNLPYNFVRAVEVKTGGYEAQYGRAIGAVVNAVTYSGTNEFEAHVFGFATHQALSAEARAEPALRETAAHSYDVGARIGGPVVRDRLWYALAYNPTVTRADREIAGHGVYQDEEIGHLFAGKLSWRPVRFATMELSLFGDPSERRGVEIPVRMPPFYAAANPDPLLVRREAGGWAASLRSTMELDHRTLLEATLSRGGASSIQEGATELGRTQPLLVDHFEGRVSGGYPVRVSLDEERWGLLTRATRTARRHLLSAGLEVESLTASRESGPTGGVGLTRLPDGSFHEIHETGAGDVGSTVVSAYAQDAWTVVGPVTVNVGVRWSRQEFTGGSGSVAQTFSNEWQPRLGIVWQPGSRHRLFGAYGRYYLQVPLNLASLFFTDFAFVERFYPVDPRPAGATPDSIKDRSRSGNSFAHDPGLSAENHDEFTVGYERLFGPASKLTLRAIRRELRSTFQWGLYTLGEDRHWVVGTPGKGEFDFLPRPKRVYSAVEAAAEGDWRRVRYRASYVLSRTHGNFTGVYDSDRGFANPGGNFTFFMPHQAQNSDGLLPNDRPHVFKLSGAVDLGHGFASGAVLTWGSGAPINKFAVGPPPGFAGTPIFVAPRGSMGRTPSVIDIDVRLAYGRAAVRGHPRLILDLLNVGNPQRAVRVNELYCLSFSDGVCATENAGYRTPTAFQRPMLARIGLEATL